MFRDTIDNTPFVTTYANGIFENKVYDNVGSNFDSSFKSTLRALLGKRLRDDEKVSVYYDNWGNSRSSVSGMLTDLSRYSQALQPSASNAVNICNMIDVKDDFISNLAEEFVKAFPEWLRVDKITEFFRKAFPVACFIDKENKNTIIMVMGMDIRKIHYLQCAIPAFLPWFFEGERALNDDDMELIRSLSERTSDHYLEVINRFAEKFNFREEGIKQMLAGFESCHMKAEIETLEYEISRLIEKISSYQTGIASTYTDKCNKEARLMGLKLASAESDGNSELMDYFLCNKKLNLVQRSGDNITFEVFDYIEIFDEEMAEQMIENDNSFIYSMRRGHITAEQMKKLMTAIFINQTMRIRTCAAYSLGVRNGISGMGEYRYSKSSGYLHNPHIHYYRCLGGYELIIAQMIGEGNYIGAVGQCIASCQSLNFGDSTVMERFMCDLYDTEGKFIELPNGEIVNPKEAVAWIESNEERNESDE